MEMTDESQHSHHRKQNIVMMYCLYVLVILATISSVYSKNIELDAKLDAPISELSSLFDIKENVTSPLEDKRNVICDSDACRIIAREFKRAMNTSVAPCDNFYDFVCGSWDDVDSIPKYEPMWGRTEIFQDTVNRRIKGILETEPEPTDILPVRQAKKWYRACMDTDTLDKRGIKPIESILQQVGGWPMTLDPEEWNENEHSWQSVEHGYFHITGSYVLYNIKVGWSGIMLKKGKLPLHDKFPFKYRNYTGDDYEAYVELIVGVALMFVEHNKAAITEEMIEEDVRDLVEFERQLYMLVESEEENYFNTQTIGEFIEWYNANVTELELDNQMAKIDFRRLLRRQFDLVNSPINNSYPLIVDKNSYYVGLAKLINQTSSRIIVNYLHWHFVSEMLIYTTELMRDAFFVLMKNEFDIKERAPRWLECIKEMEMSTASAYAFVEKYFSKEVDESAREMIENVREEMNVQIDGSEWMDDESKIIAKEKLNAMKVFIGFPDWYKNRTYVLNSYKGLTIGYDHFDNVLSFKKYEVKKSLQYTKLNSWAEEFFTGADPMLVNAFYNPMENNIALPAANFQPPLFTSQVPPSVNYGIVGLTVAHEMGHGFDDDGIKFGKDGSRTKLSKKMLDAYYERADCFVEQFNQYYGVTERPDSDKLSRGRFTRPDNIADSTGLQSVFKAFRKLIDDHSADNYKLPGFEEYTDDQMFFISFAAAWCETLTPKFAKKMEQEDNHSPGRLRVIGPLSNTEDFARAFNCPKGSPMNPEKKCNIWK